MHAALEKRFISEIAETQRLLKSGSLDEAFEHLESAHVLGQRYIVPHTFKLLILRAESERSSLMPTRWVHCSRKSSPGWSFGAKWFSAVRRCTFHTVG